jgi:hypothetical protein
LLQCALPAWLKGVSKAAPRLVVGGFVTFLFSAAFDLRICWHNQTDDADRHEPVAARTMLLRSTSRVPDGIATSAIPISEFQTQREVVARAKNAQRQAAKVFPGFVASMRQISGLTSPTIGVARMPTTPTRTLRTLLLPAEEHCRNYHPKIVM